MLDPTILSAVIQGGAVAVLIVVLWQVSSKVDSMMKNTQELLLKLIDLVGESNRKTDRNYQAITDVKPPEKRSIQEFRKDR